MRRVVSRLVVALCTFTLGFAAAALWLESRRPARRPAAGVVAESLCPPARLTLEPNADLAATAELPILAYCELVDDPDRYDGKIVRVRARLRGFIHGILFYDMNCAGVDNRTAVALAPQSMEEVRRALVEAAGSEYYGHEPLDLIAAGKFEKVTPTNESDALWDTAPLRFQIMRIERASKAR